MALSPLLKRRPSDQKPDRPWSGSDPQSRTRARRRLIGAAVLVASGLVAFPILFETQPRPVPVAGSRAAAPQQDAAQNARPGRATSGTVGELAAPSAEAAAAAVPSVPLSAQRPPAATASEVGPAQAPPAADRKAAVVVARTPAMAEPRTPSTAQSTQPPQAPAKSTERPAERAAEKPARPAGERPAEKAGDRKPEKSSDKADDKAVAKSAPQVRPAAGDSAALRYVVQVGAYADDSSAKEARSKVERLGLKTFTQDVEVQGARRIRVRVGPFDSLADAERAVATLKAGKLPGVVLKL